MSNITVIGLNGTRVLAQDCNLQNCPLEYAQIEYIPSKAVNLAWLVIFGIILVVQLVQLCIYRIWGYATGTVLGLALEVVGYAARIGLHNDPFDFNWFVIYLVCLTIAPAFISASIYLCLSRLVIVYGTDVAPFKPRTYTITFICCDFVSLLLQALGGALAATADDGDKAASDMGVHIMVAGLAFQVVSLLLFIVVAGDFARRVRKSNSIPPSPDFLDLQGRKWFSLFPIGLAIATSTIFVRCVFRVAEFSEGFSGEIANNETAYNILEGPMIFIAAIALTLFHPGLCFGDRWRQANWTWRTKSQHLLYNKASGDEIPLDAYRSEQRPV